MNTGIIYRADNLINGKCYIGQTIKSLDERIRGHYIDCKNKNYKFSNALRKYKKEDWKWEVLVENVPIDQLDLFERSYIWGLSTFEFGYNSTTGGERGVRCEETKKKLSEIAKERCKDPKNLAMLGKNHSEEAKKKMSVAHIGKVKSEETKKKLSVSVKNRWANKLNRGSII